MNNIGGYFCCCLWDRVSLYSPGWPDTMMTRLVLLVFLPSNSIFGHLLCLLLHSSEECHCFLCTQGIFHRAVFYFIFLIEWMKHYFIRESPFLIEWMSCFVLYKNVSLNCAIDFYSPVFIPLTSTVMLYFIAFHMLNRTLFLVPHPSYCRIPGKGDSLVIDSSLSLCSWLILIGHSSFTVKHLVTSTDSESVLSAHLTETLLTNKLIALYNTSSPTPGTAVLLVLLHFWLLLLFFLNNVCWFSSFRSHAGGFQGLDLELDLFPLCVYSLSDNIQSPDFQNQAWTFLNSRLVRPVVYSMFHFNI